MPENATPSPIPNFSHAQWISSSLTGSPTVPAAAPYLRKTFSVSGRIRHARLSVTALGLYVCEVNGRVVGDHVLAPGWTDYKKRLHFQEFDITALLCEGENVLGAILGDGWYSGRVAWKQRQNYGLRPQFLAQFEITLDKGSTIVIATDSSWKTCSGPILENDLLMGEAYDARAELVGWSRTGYNDEEWRPAKCLPAPEISLSKSPCPPMRRREELAPIAEKRFPQWPQDIQLYDLGQNFTGWVRIEVEAESGTTLTLRYAEVLGTDGKLYTENLRTARVTDYYTCRGGGVEIWEPRFTFHGFRHVEIAGLKPNHKLKIRGIVLRSDLPDTGHFACSHPLLNQLQKNIVWGQKSNFLDVPTDCPQRDERMGWTGDAQVFIRTSAFNMNVLSFFRKWLGDMRDAQRPNGAIPCVIPNVELDIEDGGPAWSDAAIICPWTLYLCYGADAVPILEEHYDCMERYMSFVEQHRCRDHIRSHASVDKWGGFGDWLALDGSGKNDGGTARDLIGTAFHANNAYLMARICGVLGRKDEALRYHRLHQEAVAAFRRRFLTPDGLVAGGTQTSYVLALHFNLIPEESVGVALDELLRDLEKREYHLATGFVGTPYLLDVLEKHGRLDVAYKLVEQETFPSWIFPIKNGATTVWERWDGWTTEKGFQDKAMNSFNHYAYGAVGAWMVRSIAGLDLDPNEPGYRHICFKPRPGGSITWAEASLHTSYGLVSIRWKLESESLHIDLEVPDGTRATFDAPIGFKYERSEFGPGQHSFDMPKLPTKPSE